MSRYIACLSLITVVGYPLDWAIGFHSGHHNDSLFWFCAGMTTSLLMAIAFSIFQYEGGVA